MFTAPETANYTIFANGANASYTVLTQPAWNIYFASGSFSSSDTVGNRCKMTAGTTYCFEVYSYYSSSEVQNVTLQIVPTLDLVDPVAVELQQNVPTSLTFDGTEQRQYLKVVPEKTDTYTLYCADEITSMNISLYDADFEPVYSINSTYNPIACDATLQAGQTYYFELRSWEADPAAEFVLVFRDDFLAMKRVPIQLNQTLEVAGGDYVAFTPETTGTYVFTARNGDNNGVRTVLYNADRKDLNYDYAPGVGTVIRKINAGETYYFVPEKDATCKLVSLETFAQEEGWQVVSENEEIDYVGGQNQWCVFRPETTKKYMICSLNEQWVDVRLYDSDFWRINALDLDNDMEMPKDLTAGETYYFRLRHYDENVRSTCSVMTPEAFAALIAKPIARSTPAEATRYKENYFLFTPETTMSYTAFVEAPTDYNMTLDIAIHDAAMKTVSSSSAGSSTIKKVACTAILEAGKTYYLTTKLYYTNYNLSVTVLPTADFMAANAQTLELDTPLPVALKEQVDLYFAFTPDTAGNYALTAENMRSGQIYLYDSAMNTIRSTYYGNDLDFEVRLNAGQTYYFWIVFNGYGEVNPFEITITETCSHACVVLDRGTPATCTTDGKTVGLQCTDCGKWLAEQNDLFRHHKDADSDRICDVCGQAAIDLTAPCNEDGTVTAVLYSDGEMVLTGTGTVTCAPGKPEETAFDDAAAYNRACDRWGYNMSRVQRLVISEGITSISLGTFTELYSLKELILPHSCTHVDHNAFSTGSLLTSVSVYNPDLELDGQIPVIAYGFTDSISIEEYRMLFCSYYLVLFDREMSVGKQLLMQTINTDSLDEETISEYVSLYFDQYKKEFLISVGMDPALADAAEGLSEMLLLYINDCLGTNFTCAADLYIYDPALFETGEVTNEMLETLLSQPTEAFRTAVQATYGLNISEAGNMLPNIALSTVPLGKTSEYRPFEDVLVRGYAASTAEAAAAASGVNFALLPPGGTCGDSLIWELENNTLTISGEGAMPDYTDSEPAPWMEYFAAPGAEITVLLEEGVTKIGANAFPAAEGLKELIVLNRDCDLSALAIREPAFLRGYLGSTAEDYGNAHADESLFMPLCDVDYRHAADWKVEWDDEEDPDRHIEGVYCFVCGEYIYAHFDAHEWSEWETTKEPTTEAEGEQIRTCSVCEKTETRSVEKLQPEGNGSNNNNHDDGGGFFGAIRRAMASIVKWFRKLLSFFSK